MRATICQTWEVQKANPQLAWSKPNSDWSNSPTGWGRPSTVHSTSGRKYRWQSFPRRSIGPLSGGRTVWNMFEMDPCPGKRRSQIVWLHWRTGWHWLISIILNRFTGRGLKCFWIVVRPKFVRQGKMETEATHDRLRIWESTRAQRREVTSPRPQIQCSLLWFAGCRMARIWF